MDRSTFDEFRWLNNGKARWVGDALIIDAPAISDFFCGHDQASSSEDLPKNLSNAPFFYTEVTGDFVMRVQVSHAFKDTYDAATIMVMEDLDVWAKACFEKTDFGTHAAVSVVTNRISDDANGCNIDGDTAWLQVSRVNDSFSFHYSLDGTRFEMMRFFSLPVSKTIKVGLVAQSPMGQGGERIFKQFSLQKKTVANLRFGV
jgi:regulation of enolase protein 1 (concanavalin A-like superfamily)